jgi:hypothetical protein
VVQASFAGRVSERLKGWNAETIDRADVDHATGRVWSGAGFEERSEELCYGEDAGEVEGQDTRPCFVWVGVL